MKVNSLVWTKIKWFFPYRFDKNNKALVYKKNEVSKVAQCRHSSRKIIVRNCDDQTEFSYKARFFNLSLNLQR